MMEEKFYQTTIQVRLDSDGVIGLKIDGADGWEVGLSKEARIIFTDILLKSIMNNRFKKVNHISNKEIFEATREILENTMNNKFKWKGIDDKTGELMYKSYELGREYEKKIRDYIKENK